MTIGDVYLPDQPSGAAVRVRAWAASIRHHQPPRLAGQAAEG
jgi:hypothetical protein